MARLSRATLAFAAYALALSTNAPSQDFINYRGTTGNGIYPGVGLLKQWPEEGPRLLWTFQPGEGWASPSVVDGKVYVVGSRIGQIWTLDLDGNPVGQRIQVGSMEWKRFSGSRGVPLVKDGVAVVNAPNANYWGMDLATGEARWQVNAWKSFGDGKGGMGWGVPESPMLIDNKVIFNTCSRTNGQPAFVALDIATGKTIWGMKTPKKYSATDVSGSWGIHNGRKLYFCATWCWFVCLDADTGELLWEIRNEGATTFVPIYSDGYLLWGDARGALHMMKLAQDGRSYKRLWSRPESYCGYAQGALVGDKVFTFSRRSVPACRYDDDGNTFTNETAAAVSATQPEEPKEGQRLVCLDRDTGRLLKSRPAPRWPGHVISADGMVYVTEVEAVKTMIVSLIRPTPDGFDQVSSFRYETSATDAYEANGNTAIHEGRLFVRYGGLRCFDLRADLPYTGDRSDGSGVFRFASPPIQWSLTRNFGWKNSSVWPNGSAPVAADGKVFVTTSGCALLCLNAADGRTNWSQDVPTCRLVGSEGTGIPPPVVRAGRIHVSFMGDDIRTYDMEGRHLWTADPNMISGVSAAPVPFRDVLLVPGWSGLTALNAATGAAVWSYKTNNRVSCVVPVYAAGEPTVVTDGGSLLNLADGRELATGIFGGGGSLFVTADVQECRVFAVTRTSTWYCPSFWSHKFSAQCVALPARTNTSSRTLWNVRVKGTDPATPPVLYGGHLYIVCADRTLVVLDAKTGVETSRIALNPKKQSKPGIEPYLSVAGRRLYVQNVGCDNRTVVLQPGPKPAVLWQYATTEPSAALAFLDDAHFIRAGSTLWCMRGKTPVEPRDPQVRTIEAQAFLDGADLKAPVVPFANRAVPDKWLLANPCYPSTLMTNFLSGLGPIEKLKLSDGQSLRAGYTTIAFRPSEPRDFWKSGHSGNFLAFDFTLMTSRRPGTVYAYAVIENEKDRYVEYNPIAPGQYWRDFGDTLAANSWISGAPIDQGSTFLLKKGRHGLLIQAAVGKPYNDWGKIFMTPHLTDVDAKAQLALKQYAEDRKFWAEYAKTKDQLLVLDP